MKLENNFENKLIAEDILWKKRRNSAIIWTIGLIGSAILVLFIGNVKELIIYGATLTTIVLTINMLMNHIKYEIVCHENLKEINKKN